MYASGTGVAQDKVRAERLYRQACAAGVAAGCEALQKLGR
jgi:TPR repeat protein